MHLPARKWTAVLCFVCLIELPATLSACPNCKGALESSSQSMAIGYAWSIGMMLAIPAILIGAWSVALWRLSRAGLLGTADPADEVTAPTAPRRISNAARPGPAAPLPSAAVVSPIDPAAADRETMVRVEV